MAKEICDDCGSVFDGGRYSFLCPKCKKRRLSESAKRRKLNEIGNKARKESDIYDQEESSCNCRITRYGYDDLRSL